MLPQILTATLPECCGALLTMMAFGAYHGLNPGMGWLFALSLGLQSQSERAIWRSLFPIAAGHALSLLVVAMTVMAGAQFLPAAVLEIGTAVLLIGFGLYKVFNYYRHPRWVGMQVGMRDLTWWSFLMASAHGAGLMIAPLILSMSAPSAEMHIHHTALASEHAAHHAGMGISLNPDVTLGILLHTLAMLAVMALVAWLVYKKLGLRILRSHWINFDLIWAAALLVVGAIALLGSIRSI
ncbi:MAG TPA: hypothetical protein VFR47_04745 [Anaerolineales bacterium]|nr:hypothetical protein [Anaerolineales bacterium]